MDHTERDPHGDLERFVGSELRQLPLPTAPPSLLPRVMAAVAIGAEREAARSPARGWRTWPLGWQIASAAMLLAFVAGLWMAPLAVAHVPQFAPAVQTLDGIGAVSRVLSRVLVQPALVVALFLTLMTAAIIAAGRASFARLA